MFWKHQGYHDAPFLIGLLGEILDFSMCKNAPFLGSFLGLVTYKLIRNINAWANPVSAMGPRIRPRINAPSENPVLCRITEKIPHISAMKK
jgi:hypothetical protein